jgi:hypothetical protein
MGTAMNDTNSQPNESPTRVERIERDDAGRLQVYITGRDEPIAGARLARYFPWSLPGAYISVRDADNHEVVMLNELDELDDASRAVAEQELADKIFNPKITQVISHKREFGITTIHAMTDRGRVEFQFEGRDNVRVLSPTRALFRDVDGNTLELPDLNQLDPASRRFMSRYF